MDNRDRASAIQATMSLRQKARLLSRRANSKRAAIASWLVGVLVDMMLSNSMLERDLACAACSSRLIDPSDLNSIRSWYFVEHGGTCLADFDTTELNNHGMCVRAVGRLLRHVNALEMPNV